jgi:hypothetical protein
MFASSQLTKAPSIQIFFVGFKGIVVTSPSLLRAGSADNSEKIIVSAPGAGNPYFFILG